MEMAANGTREERITEIREKIEKQGSTTSTEEQKSIPSLIFKVHEKIFLLCILNNITFHLNTTIMSSQYNSIWM